MAFCPFYDLQCPEDSSCALWRSYGCAASHLPGIPAMYGGEIVVIIDIKVAIIKDGKECMIIYYNQTTGVMGYVITGSDLSDILGDFTVIV